MPIHGKNLLKSFFSRTKGQVTFGYAAMAQQSLFKWWPWIDLDLFYGKVRFASLFMFLYGKIYIPLGKMLENHLMEETYNERSRVAKGLVSGLYTCIKRWKNVYKIGLQRDFFLNLQQMGKVIRPFCLHQNFVSKGYSAASYIKSLNVYKIGLQRDCLWNLQQMGKMIRPFVDVKILSPSCLPWGYIHI